MTDELRAGAGVSERALHAGADTPAAPRKRRMSARRKQEAVLRLLRGDRDRPAHRLDLRREKGTPPSIRSIFASSSSFVIVRSPIFSRIARSSRSR